MLMLGREVASPIDISLPELQQEERYAEAHLVKLKEVLEKSQECAREVLKTKLQRMKKFNDANSHEQKFKTGDAVYVLMKVNKKHKKLHKVWCGPGVITAQLSPVVFRIRMHNRTTKVVNHDHLKLCTDSTLPVWIKNLQKSIKEGSQLVNCKCGQPDEKHSTMIQCDHCLCWYHSPCVNLTQQQALKMKTFICPLC